MKIKTQNYGDVTVVELYGELTGDFTEQFQGVVTTTAEESKLGVILDMCNVGFIDSEGLEQLLWARDYCNEQNCQLRLAGLDESCAKILEITRLDSEFDQYSELAEAVKSFA